MHNIDYKCSLLNPVSMTQYEHIEVINFIVEGQYACDKHRRQNWLVCDMS